MASEWGPFHDGSHSTGPVMTFTMFHTHRHTHTLMGPVTAVTFAGAGPQTGRRGPREPQAAIVLSPRKPASLCQTCFSVCFLFYVFNVGKGNVSPLIYHPPPPPIPPHCTVLHHPLPPPTIPIFLPLPPIHPHLFLLFASASPLCCPHPTHSVSPWRSSFVKLFA